MEREPHDLNHKPTLELVSKGMFGKFPTYKTLLPYKFYFNHKGKLAYFWIPSGFEYDGATMGSFLFWRKEMHTSPYTLAHDCLYVNKGNVHARYDEFPVTQDSFTLSKHEADVIFLEGARRYHNVQNWRTYVASGAFKTISWLYWLT